MLCQQKKKKKKKEYLLPLVNPSFPLSFYSTFLNSMIVCTHVKLGEYEEDMTQRSEDKVW